MIKNNKGTVILTSFVILIPMLLGLIFWNEFPDQMPVHWNTAGEIDSWGSKLFAVVLLPLFLLAVHWFCIIVTASDPKSKNISGIALQLVLWICPVMSLLVEGLVFATGIGLDISVEVVMPLVIGAMFLVLGNYLPKCRQNYTIGIKVSWALEDEANWNATHRFAGWVTTVGSLLIMATSFFGNIWLFLGITLVIAFAPMVYSYLYYRKHKKGTADGCAE